MIMRKHYSLYMYVCVCGSKPQTFHNASWPGQSALTLSLSLLVRLSLLRLCALHVLGQAHYKLTYVCEWVCVQRCICACVCVGAHQFMVGHVWIANEKLMGTQSKCCLSFGSSCASPLSLPPFSPFSLLLLLLSVLMCVSWERLRSVMCFSRLAL